MTTSESGGRPPNPEVVERAKRRRFSAEYKLNILREAERRTPGELGALLEGAEVIVELHEGEAARPRELARGRTGPGGVYGFGTPSDVASDRIALSVRHPDFNPRRVRLDGKRLAIDLRAALYGS